MIEAPIELHKLPSTGFPAQILQISSVHLPPAIQTNTPNMPHPSDSSVNKLGSNNGQSSTYVSIYFSLSRLSLSYVSSDGPDLPIDYVLPVETPWRVALSVRSVPYFISTASHARYATLRYFSSCFLSYPDRIVVMSLHPSSFQSKVQMGNKIPYAREITTDD